MVGKAPQGHQALSVPNPHRVTHLRALSATSRLLEHLQGVSLGLLKGKSPFVCTAENQTGCWIISNNTSNSGYLLNFVNRWRLETAKRQQLW